MTAVELDTSEKTMRRENGTSGRLLLLWWRIVDLRVGIVPLPVLLLLLALLAGLAATGSVPHDILTNIAILSIGGFLCAELGRHIPILRNIGAAAILATFVPSYLVYAHLLPHSIIVSVTEFTQASNFLYLFIASIVVGSILGMDRHVLIAGFLKIFVPLAVGTVLAMLAGSLAGWALGLGLRHAFFYVVVPVMAGGVGEGAIPLSIGYSGILGSSQGDVLAQVLPPVMLGSLTAIVISGVLNYVGKRRPHLTGEGRLVPTGAQELSPETRAKVSSDVGTVAAACVTAVSFYLVGVLVQRLWHWPAPVTMLFLAVALKLVRAVSPALQDGAAVLVRFFATAVTYPLLFAIGVAMTPWAKLIAALSLANVVTILVTVTTLVAAGFVTGRLVGMYPIDVAIVTACRSGQGGTGDVAILTAANRMQLMPFAQIATRIGGAITVTLALVLFSRV